MILESLTVTLVGNHPPMRVGTYNYGITFGQGGNNNLIKGVTINLRGSHFYGYGHALMYEKMTKRDALGRPG